MCIDFPPAEGVDMIGHAGQEVSYQRLLRALGGYLDQEPPGRFRVLEVLEGFTVLVERGGGRPLVQQVHFERTTLAQQAEQLVRGRKVFSKGPSENWHLCRSGHQDFLRALGYELDDSEARGLSVDELEDGLVVTYSYLDPTQGYSWRKHVVLLREPEMQEILKAAKSRKQRGFLSSLRR
jgi:hypothetical protein